MLNALALKFPDSKRQRCVKHKMENVLSYIRTTNVIERLYGEVKKRAHKMAAAFRNEESCLLMFYAIIRSLKFRRISIPVPQPAA